MPLPPQPPVVECDVIIRSPPPPPFLPLRQEEAVHTFLDRVRNLRDDINECTLCFERYQGVARRHCLVCSRCRKEVCFSLFRTHRHTHTPALQQTGHRYDAANHANPGMIPAELLDILDGITQMEEMLCSLGSLVSSCGSAKANSTKPVGASSRLCRTSLLYAPPYRTSQKIWTCGSFAKTAQQNETLTETCRNKYLYA